MGNGGNESIQFTRGDAERLGKIEIRHDELHEKVDLMMEKIDTYSEAHRTEHAKLAAEVRRNARFRRGVVKTTLWAVTPTGVFAVIARVCGWF